MAGTHTAAFGIFSSRVNAESCVDEFLESGFGNNDVSVLVPDPDFTRELTTETNTKAPEGATTGATTGSVVGGTLGLLAGVAALAIPDLGPFIASGPIMGALTGLGGGAAAGGLIGAFVGIGIPEYEAKRYEGHVKDGRIIVSAHCGDSEWVGKAKEILRLSGAEDIASAGERSANVPGAYGIAEFPAPAGVFHHGDSGSNHPMNCAKKRVLEAQNRAATALYVAALNQYRRNRAEEQEPELKRRLDEANEECGRGRKDLANHQKVHGC